MKFYIHRASDRGDTYLETPPVEGAVLEELPYHTVSNGGRDIKVDMRQAWTIEVDSLEQLMKMIDINGIIVDKPDKRWGYQLPKIQIYDDYIE